MLGRTDPGVHPPVRRLPITTPPFPSETVGSYARRLAIANHLHPGEFELYLRRRERHVNPARLAAVSGRPLSLLQRALPELRTARDLPASFDHHEPTLACRYCTAARGITGAVTCWAPPHRNVCMRHRRWVGHIDPAFQGLLDGRDPQPDLTLLPDVVSAERRLRRLTAGTARVP
jgi:TniQ